MRTGDTLGAVLVGGASRRFGSDKARAHFRGEPMLRRVLRAMEGATERVVLVGAATGADPAGGSGEALADIVDREGGGRGGEERGGLDVEVLADTVADAGPLAGLHAALREARRCGLGGVLAAGCDLPLLTPALLARIAEVGRGSGRSAAVPVLGPGRLQPLAAWYSLRCLDAAEARLAGEERSLVGLLSRVDAVRIPTPELRGEGEGEVEVTLRLTGANTPEELAALDAEGPGPGRTPLPPSLSVIGYKDSGKTGV
ncbi:MAG: molybdenum cofactor guanylyltransferase, partial [bacterium]